MQIFDDIGFEILPKYPVQVLAQVIQVDLKETPVEVSIVNSIKPNKSKGLVLFIIGIFVLSIASIIYLSTKDSEKENNLNS
jgi:hypothetical protein